MIPRFVSYVYHPILLSLCVFFIRTSVSASPSVVVELDSSSFEHQTQASTGQTTGKWFVKYYAPWCGHCKQLAPTWQALAKTVSEDSALGDEFLVAKVDCTTSDDVCSRFGVTGYPTLKLIANGQVYNYEGARTLDALKDYLLSGTFGTGEAVPPPPSFFQRILRQNKDLKILMDDFDHIISYRKNGAVVLFSLGVIWGILLMAVFQMILSAKFFQAKKPKTD